MSQNMTIDDIWKLFQETNRLFQESALEAERRRQEAEQLAALRRQEAEQLAEQRRQEAEQLAEQLAALRRQEAEQRFLADERRRQEAEREILELRRTQEETARVVKEVSRQIGQLGSRWGEFVEGLVAPACETMFAERGIPVHKVHPRVRAKYPGGRHMEIDLLVVNTDAVVLVEVKSKLRHEDVREHVARLANFKEFFREYADKRVFGAVAGIVIEENVDNYAMNEGLFVIVQSGETVMLANAAEFTPRTW